MHRARRLRRGSASLVLSAIGGLLAFSLAFASPQTREEGIKLALSDAQGSLALTNSREGAAILGAAGMRPGDQTVGSVTIGNAGTVPSALFLQASTESETTSSGGGRMWTRLLVAIADVTDPQNPTGIYNGPIQSLGQLNVGGLQAGQERDFRFVATLPDGDSVTDNSFQGAGVSALFTWTATGDEIVTPTPTPVTPTPVTPAPAPTPAPLSDVRNENASQPSADALLRLPSSRRCVSARKFVIHLRKKKGTTIRSAVVYVNGKTKVKVKGKKKLRAAINLKGLPPGTVKVKIVLTTSKGQKLTSTRTYKTCKPKSKTAAQKKRAKAKAKALARAKAKARR